MTYRKGEKGENEVCNKLEELEIIEASRNLSERRSGDKGDLDTNTPFEYEVKVQDQPSIWKAMEQAEEHAEANEDDVRGIAFLRRKNGQGVPSERVVGMSWDTFLEFLDVYMRNEV